MSWRFRKTFKVLPGVKLNLTRNGLSATVGASPFSINVGPRGVYSNVTIPGTGIWSRDRIDIPSLTKPDVRTETPNQGNVNPLRSPIGSPSPTTEIRSASTETLSSGGLEPLRNLLKEAFDERDVLGKEIANADLEAEIAQSRYEDWNHGLFLKRTRGAAFVARKEAADAAVAKSEELREQLRLTTLPTDIACDQEQTEPYYQMRDEFCVLSGSQKIWSIVAEREIDRFTERTTAHKAITRHPVSFSLDSCDLIQWEQKVPHLQNHTGGDMYIYPGFILYRASKQAFALIEVLDVTVRWVPTHFTEHETPPSDAEIIEKTWYKSNRDGSPDRRFQGNFELPVMNYADLLFSTPDGLDVRYMCSNANFAERFAKSWEAVRTSFSSKRSGDNKGSEKPHPSEPFAAAYYQTFKPLNQKFIDTIAASGAKMPKCEIIDYLVAAKQFTDAAHEYKVSLELRPFPQLQAVLQVALDKFTIARVDLEHTLCEDRDHAGAVCVYFEELSSFYVVLHSIFH